VIYTYRQGDETVSVELQREGDAYRIRIGERELRLEARETLPGTYLVRQGQETLRVHVARGDGVIYVALRGRVYELHRPGAEDGGGAGEEAGVEMEGGVLKTPMPGRIVSVEVEEGQSVTAGQVLLVLESMKMQNSIVSPVAGRVTRIHRRPGELAAYGDPLVEIETAE
jgi:biotin carboxyl carrier protein